LSLALPPAEFFVGVDWAAEVHAVCVINIEGKVLSQLPWSIPPAGSPCWCIG
jgi:hypothetical protein